MQPVVMRLKLVYDRRSVRVEAAANILVLQRRSPSKTSKSWKIYRVNRLSHFVAQAFQ